MRKIYFPLIFTFLLFAIPAPDVRAEENIGVVTTIKPLHSLTAAIMQGVGEPHLIIQGAGNPHAYNLRPSDAQALAQAQLVFWIGPELESFLAAALTTIGSNAQTVALSENEQLTLFPFREEEAEPESDDHDHHHDGTDMHIWLSPENAAFMVEVISQKLAEVDPVNADKYRANTIRLKSDLAALNTDLRDKLTAVQSIPYITFHDSFQYFEKLYDLNHVGTIAVSPNSQISAKKIQQIRAFIAIESPACIFTEPQYNTRIVNNITEGFDVNTASIDALGQALDAGPNLYFALIQQNAASFVNCLTK